MNKIDYRTNHLTEILFSYGDTNTKANRRKHTVKMRMERKETKKKNNRQNQWNKMEERP